MQPDSLASAAATPTHTTGRLQYIDIAKGIAILAVIIGHAAIRLTGLSHGAATIVAVCFTFHMPLFFLLSGYFLHYERPFNWKKEAKRLVVPYIVAALVIVILEALTTFFLRDQPQGMSLRRYVAEWLNAAVFGAASLTGKELWPQVFRIGAIWFLLALFWARLFVTCSCKTRYSGIFVLILALAGSASARYIYLPYLRSHKLVLIPALLIWLYAILHYTGFGMGTADFGATPLDIARNLIGSLGGMVSIVIISMYIEQLGHWVAPHLAEIGRISLLILVVHIIDDDVTRIDAMNLFLLSSGLGAFKLAILDSVSGAHTPCSYHSCSSAFPLSAGSSACSRLRSRRNNSLPTCRNVCKQSHAYTRHVIYGQALQSFWQLFS